MDDAPSELARGRRRALLTYIAAAALTSVAYISTFQNASVLAPQITGTAATGGLPSSAAVGGTALAAVVLSGLMATRGRRTGIVAGIGVAIVGSALTVVAVLAWSFLLLVTGALLIGFGNAAINLSRYAASDLYPAQRRAGAVGLVVWGSTVGAVVGPNLSAPANAAGQAMDLPRFAGAFGMALAFLAVAAAIALRGPRAPESRPSPESEPAVPPPATPMHTMLAALFATTRGRTAVAALVSGQLVMVLIMTMTPFHLNHTGHGDGVIGLVISAHMFGMFALSPISGRLTERFGPTGVIMVGFVTLAAAGLLGAATPSQGGQALMLPLFLLGFGWNMTFVAGSSLLAAGEVYADRARLQGVVDAFVWGAAAVAGIAAGFVVELASYAILSAAGAGLALVLAALILFDRRTVRSAEA